MNPHQVTADFEKALCEYTGAKYAVAVNSCTMALFLSLMWCGAKGKTIRVPKRTYCSVPMQIIHAGGKVEFTDQEWKGGYSLYPLPIYDFARRFTSGMYYAGTFQCLSFHWSKILGIEQGGAILHDSDYADSWFRRARFDGRAEGVDPKDDIFDLGWHCYMSPEIAAAGLKRLSLMPLHNHDLPNSDYPDLSLQPLFKEEGLTDLMDDQQMKFANDSRSSYAMKVIDDIEKIRTKNNGNWMDILRLAFRHDPEGAAAVMKKIYVTDQEISALAERLTS